MLNETRFSNLPDGDNVRVSNMAGRFSSIQCNPTTNLGARGENKGIVSRPTSQFIESIWSSGKP
ncbi:hypothetical protein Tco_0607539, partial [Tanacetum coccineum]